MTVKEAIKQLESLIDDRESFICDDSDDDDIYHDDIEALKIGISALKKQKPEKVLDNGYNVHFCPNCKGSVWQIKCESKYCFRCGQTLDWRK